MVFLPQIILHMEKAAPFILLAMAVFGISIFYILPAWLRRRKEWKIQEKQREESAIKRANAYLHDLCAPFFSRQPEPGPDTPCFLIVTIAGALIIVRASEHLALGDRYVKEGIIAFISMDAGHPCIIEKDGRPGFMLLTFAEFEKKLKDLFGDFPVVLSPPGGYVLKEKLVPQEA